MISKAVSAERYSPISLHDLPAGTHKGTWGGNVVTVCMQAAEFRLMTDVAIKTPNAPCTVRVHEDGHVTVSAD